MSGPLVRIEGLSKSFHGTPALRDVSIDVVAGEVHGLVGQNGSGKSTLIKILSGYHAPDAGSVTVAGADLKLPPTLRDLRERGIEFVHQDLGLVPTLSVLENLRVGRYQTGPGRRIRWRQERARSRELLERFSVPIDPGVTVDRLSRAEQAIVAIMRALSDLEDREAPGLLVLDEPTAALPGHEVADLFEAVRHVAASGTAVLIVTHNLDEVFEITDRVSVLRDGRLVAVRETAGLAPRELIELIVGRKLEDLYPEAEPAAAQQTALSVRDLAGAIVRGASFDVRAGEILGVTGLVGAGHDEVPYLVYGAQRPRGGTVELAGGRLDPPSPDRARRAGLVLLPADRQHQSAILTAKVRENVTIGALSGFRGRLGSIQQRRERSAVQDVLHRFGVQPPEPERPMATLSGGNQQKALLGRCMRLDPRVLLLHEPTQGVDVGARRAIFDILRDAVAAGTAVVYASSEYEELAHLCDRVIVFRRGEATAELRGDALSHDAIVAHCYRTAAAA